MKRENVRMGIGSCLMTAFALALVGMLFTVTPAQAYIIHYSETIDSEIWDVGTHYVSGSITVNAGQTLTVLPGAVVKFAPSTQLVVNGTLSAPGTAWTLGNYIVFTSRDDDTHGDTITESDGSPSAGDWYGIYLYGYDTSDGIGLFDYCRLRYGGNTVTDYDANLYFDRSDSGHFTNSISEYSVQYGVQVYLCSPEITSSTFANNTSHGLYVRECSSTITSSTFANNTSHGLYVRECSPTITSNTFASNTSHGLYVWGNVTSAALITDNTFTSNGDYGANLTGITLTDYSGNTGSGNGTNGFGVSGTVSSNRTWSCGSGTFPFVLTGTVTVNDNQTLTLSAGTIVKGASTGQLTVNGTLDVNGTSGSNVVFTSLKDDSYGGDTNGDAGATSPAAGDWYGIYLYGYETYNGIGLFDYCRLRYGGHTDGSADANVYFHQSYSGHFTDSISEYSVQYGVQVRECSPEITSSTFANNTSHGLYVWQSEAAPITDNTFTDNTQYGAYLNEVTLTSYSGNTGTGNGTNGFGVKGTVSANCTWSCGSGTFPFVLVGRVTVNSNKTLTVPAGTIVKGDSYGELYVKGTLDVNGTSGSNVVFTSLKDDSYGGDTDGDHGDPAGGDWYGIYLNGSATASQGIGQFDYCRLRYGGNTSGSADANVSFYYSDSGNFTNSISETSAQYGVRVRDSSPEFRGSRIQDNTGYGVYIQSGGTPNLGTETDPGKNTLRDNGTYDVYSESRNTISAEKNYWEYITSTEIGGRIYNYGFGFVVDYDPWLPFDQSLGTEVKTVAGGDPDPVSFNSGKVETDFSAGTGGDVGVLFENDPVSNRSSVGTGVDHVAKSGFYTINTDKTGYTCSMVFSYAGIRSWENVTDESDLIMCRWNGSQWEKPGTQSVDIDNDKITVNAVSAFSEWTLGSSTADNPLPVVLSSFTAQAGNGEVTLRWITESEIDNLGFHIYRAFSEEGEYERLTAELIEGAGSSSGALTYRFVDGRLKNEVTYWYKLEDVGFDGTTTLHGPLAVTLKEVRADAETVALPASFGLYQNAPNPFNPATVIRYDVPEACVVRLTVYDVLGRAVAALVDGEMKAGRYTAVWEAKEAASGVYFVRMEAGDFVSVRKMVVMR